MQEDLENKTVTIAVSGAKMSGRVLKTAIQKLLEYRKHPSQTKGVTRHGKQTVKQLIGQDQGVSTIELNDPDIKRFERIARTYGVDYAIKKVNGKDDYYQIFFKARDADALTSALTEFANQKHVRSKKPSALQLMKSLKAKLMTMDKKVTKDKTKEHSL